MFSQLCNELGSEHLLHTEVQWLSHEKFVERLFELQEEVLLFLLADNKDLALLVSKLWLGKLTHPADIINLLNRLNSLEETQNSLISQNKIIAFTKKLQIWKNRINSNVQSTPVNQTPFVPVNNIQLARLSD